MILIKFDKSEIEVIKEAFVVGASKIIIMIIIKFISVYHVKIT